MPFVWRLSSTGFGGPVSEDQRRRIGYRVCGRSRLLVGKSLTCLDLADRNFLPDFSIVFITLPLQNLLIPTHNQNGLPRLWNQDAR
jgi:hypothetical protein